MTGILNKIIFPESFVKTLVLYVSYTLVELFPGYDTLTCSLITQKCRLQHTHTHHAFDFSSQVVTHMPTLMWNKGNERKVCSIQFESVPLPWCRQVDVLSSLFELFPHPRRLKPQITHCHASRYYYSVVFLTQFCLSYLRVWHTLAEFIIMNPRVNCEQLSCVKQSESWPQPEE